MIEYLSNMYDMLGSIYSITKIEETIPPKKAVSQ